MTLNQSPSHSWLAKAARFFGKGLAGVSVLTAAGGLTAGCLDRPVTPATPQTTNVYISKIRQTGVDKIDLLFMIDNSISMSDKQQILSDAVPVLVQRLITPACVDQEGNPVGGSTDDKGLCANGVAEFKPIKNIHIGVITSSLGDHGSNDVCSPAQNEANVANGGTLSNYDDLAQLMPTIRTTTPALHSWNNSGFLVWDPRVQSEVPQSDRHIPAPGAEETQKQPFIDAFRAQVEAAGEHGCGYEASLEAWYRFLIDPEPVNGMTNDKSVAHRGAVNNTVLAQRKAFLRPDSLLAVVMLTDENDCSIIDEEGVQGWLVGYKGGVGQLNWRMPRASAGCSDPNSTCCRPCTSAPGAGCPDNATDTACMIGTQLALSEDSPNERCFNQVRRFGIDLLYPTGRYVEGLKSHTVQAHFGKEAVPNPIYESVNGNPPRESELVFLAGLVGVPWQDISTPESWMGRSLKYMKAADLATEGRWDVILGDPRAGIPPTDALMIESIQPRPIQNHPLLPGAQYAIVPETSTNNSANAINGHEQKATADQSDLQFACIFDLAPPKSVADCDANSDGCDCNAEEFDKNSPLCQGVTADATGSQVKAKGYPGVRELQVLKEYGPNSIVASICPKNVMAQGGDPSADPDYGYNPAVAAIVDRLKEALTVKCLPRPLTPGTPENSAPEDVGKVPCSVVEVRPMENGACADCAALPGRSTLDGDRAKVIPAAKEFLRNDGTCDGASAPCDSYCFCALNQFTGEDLRLCQTQDDPGTKFGYCYVDPEAARISTPDDTALIEGEERLVKDCASTQRRILRFMGNNVPAKDGLAFIACIGGATAEQ